MLQKMPMTLEMNGFPGSEILQLEEPADLDQANAACQPFVGPLI